MCDPVLIAAILEDLSGTQRKMDKKEQSLETESMRDNLRNSGGENRKEK
jgi:hypothetical protein